MFRNFSENFDQRRVRIEMWLSETVRNRQRRGEELRQQRSGLLLGKTGEGGQPSLSIVLCQRSEGTDVHRF